jgi:hypothetical protein
MCTILSASFEGVFSVQGIWTYCSKENRSLFGECTQLRIIQVNDLDSCAMSAYGDFVLMVLFRGEETGHLTSW